MLNVAWNWRMPTVGDPDKVAAGNRQDFLSGLDSIASGLIKSGENKRADEKQQWLETTDARDFAERVKRDDQKYEFDLAGELRAQAAHDQNMKMGRLNYDKAAYDFARKKKQDEYFDKMYAQYFADADQQELARLLAKYQGKNDATSVMNGLNPLFLNMR